MLEVLDKILLSSNVVKDFIMQYENNVNFKKWLLEILPEVEDCKNQKQDNPWHIYDCLTHILYAVKNINKLSQNLNFDERRMLAYCMFLHDMGKPAKHIRRFSKMYNKEVDSFFEHNIKSAKIALRVLPKLNFNKEQAFVMEKLILKHDIFMFITLNKTSNPHHKVLTKQLILNEIKDLSEVGDGKKFMKFLILIGRADNLSQNPQLTQESLSMLNKLEEILKDI